MTILHGYYRSSAAFRVRIALNLKGSAARHVFHHLRHGEQKAEAYRALNPQAMVPALELDDGRILTQSLAILEYLDETHPDPALLPSDPLGRARVRALAQIVACDIHPIDNLRVLTYLRGTLAQPEEAVRTWYNHWIAEGFEALEQRLAEPETGRFCHGDSPTLADLCLVPQVLNAGNFALDMTPYPRIRAIQEAALALPAFTDALPKNQPDAE